MAIDVSKPSIARMYNFFLGGNENFAVDREACRELLLAAPSTREICQINRLFLKRAVHHLAADLKIRQFIDHGAGLPAQDNVHQVAQAADREARVVYIDNDPMVVAQGRLLLDENEQTAFLAEDIRRTEAIWRSEKVTRLISCNEPVAALFVSVLHCLKRKDDPWKLIRDVTRRLPSGSCVVICQMASEDTGARARLNEYLGGVDGRWGEVRSFTDVERFFDGLEPIGEIGEVSRWRPDIYSGVRQTSWEWVAYGGVAQVP
ncbi:SAM-dependent methyltransferase [Streptomyces sp. NPDC047046]|uniref:SAM-dependent methyltransferase n=1 Tax=Streptomyces sp. NPDC047046 TaxID=3155378 RepID=UPI0033FA9B83